MDQDGGFNAGRPGVPPEVVGDDGRRARRFVWPVLAGVFALIAVLLAGILIGSRSRSATPPPASSLSLPTPASPSPTPTASTARTTTPAPTTTAGAVSPTAGATSLPSGPAPPGPTPRTVIDDCASQPLETPAQFILACGDANASLTDLQWVGWGDTTAHASGFLIQNSCTPNCAEGGPVRYPASVTVSRIDGGRYTLMHVSAPQASGGPFDYLLTPLGPT